MKLSRSEQLFKRALRVMVGGVNSPVRAFRAVGGTPLFIANGRGPRVWDADGNSFIDYVCSWGPLIAGHCHPQVVAALASALRQGTNFGAPSEPELRLAELVCSSIPSVELVRFVNSGTEATMSALRLARAFTKRWKVLKFDGCYHGHADAFLTHAGSGLATFDTPSSEGIPPRIASETLTVAYNDMAAVESAFREHGDELAGVIVEPVAGNMGVVPPARGFLEGIRKLCTSNGSVLIFDEVITGFRLSKGGAQELFGIRPDITTFGKIIGGGLPVGAYGGRKEIMRMVSPEGPVYQAGTLSGNPLAMTAGLATVGLLRTPAYAKLDERSAQLEEGLAEGADKAGVPLVINRVGSMLGLFFTRGEVTDFDTAKRTDVKLYAKFHRAMLEGGVYLAPSAFETAFVSTVHKEKEIAATLSVSGKVLRELAP